MDNNDLYIKLAEKIQDGSVISGLPFILLCVALVLVAGVAAAAFVGFGKAQGEFSSLKSNFNDVKNQLDETTKIVAKVDMVYWQKKEIEAIRRVKLEELYTSLLQAYDDQATFLKAMARNTQEFVEPSRPMHKASMLTAVYFHEVMPSFQKFYSDCADIGVFVNRNITERKMKMEQDMLEAFPAPSEADHEEVQKLYMSLKNSWGNLQTETMLIAIGMNRNP